MSVQNLITVIPSIPTRNTSNEDINFSTIGRPIINNQSIDNIEGLNYWLESIASADLVFRRIRSADEDEVEVSYNANMFDILFSKLPTEEDKTNIFIQVR